MGILFGGMKAAGILRVTADIEDVGLDDSKHGGAMSEVAVVPSDVKSAAVEA